MNSQTQFSPDFYDHEYFDGGTGKSAYGDYGPGLIKGVFLPLARELKRIFRPKRVLDVGCAKGYFVDCFRSLGVEAFGFDFSSYALGCAESRSKRFLAQASADYIPFPDNYFDLVVSTDVLEHLTVAQAEKAVQEISRVTSGFVYTNICLALEPGLSDDFFRTDPNDLSHITCASRAFWNKRFLQAGLTLRHDLEEQFRVTDVWRRFKWEIFILQIEGPTIDCGSGNWWSRFLRSLSAARG